MDELEISGLKEKIEELETKVDALEEIIAKICMLKDGSRYCEYNNILLRNDVQIDDDLAYKLNDIILRKGC